MTPAGTAAAGGPTLEPPIRICMWSGPRNLSTALMRSFGNRADCGVADEPFYAAYLKLSGADHPMRQDILHRHETDWRKVAECLLGPAPGGGRIFYQKHMTHHMVPEIGRDWMRECRHAFLIRHPMRVLASYAGKRGPVELEDIGFLEQAELFEEACDMKGSPAPVIDADRLLADPGGVLAKLCEALGIAFSGAMLHWAPGRRDSDGVWARHWYDAVDRSTGFGPARALSPLEEPRLLSLAARAQPIYDGLAAHALG